MTIDAVCRVVEHILRTDPRARDSDKYLYREVVRYFKPDIMKLPFEIAIMCDGIPNTETVRRSRQKLQADYPELAASAQVEGYRMVEEQKFFDFAIS